MTTSLLPQKFGYSIREACAATSLGRTSIFKHLASGRLKAVRLGRRTIITAESLHALLGDEAARNGEQQLAPHQGDINQPQPTARAGACCKAVLLP
jgi:excisionase family DNA binding protein